MNSAPLFSKAQCIDGYSALEMLNHTNSFSVAWNKMYRRFLFSAIRFPVGKINEDTFIMHLLLFQCSKVIILPEKLYFYVQTPGSIMRTEKTVRHLDAVEALYRRYLFYERNGLKCFLPDTAMTVFYWFEDLIRQIRTIRPEEKQRVHEIRRMVRYCFLRHGEKINKWEIVHFECPGLFHFLRKVKRRFIMPIKTRRH